LQYEKKLMAYETTAAAAGNIKAGTSAGWGRVLVAIFVDYLVFSTLLFFALYVYGLFVYGTEGAHGARALAVQNTVGFIFVLVLFAVIELTMFFALKLSLGRYLLSIGPDYSIDPQFAGRDGMLTILLALVTLYGGLSQMTDWIIYVFPTPMFGGFPGLGPLYDTVLKCLIGMFWAMAGLMLFKLSRFALVVVILATVGEIVSIVLSWKLWQETAPMLAVGRQSIFGGDLSGPALEFVRDYYPQILILVSTIYLLLIMAAAPQFLARGEPAGH
jgi:hypothetical protein